MTIQVESGSRSDITPQTARTGVTGVRRAGGDSNPVNPQLCFGPLTRIQRSMPRPMTAFTGLARMGRSFRTKVLIGAGAQEVVMEKMWE